MRSLQVPTSGRFRLDEGSAADTTTFDGKKDEAEERTGRLRDDLDRLQELLYADHKHSLLIVLQGMDTAGKDGVIRHVFSGVNPQGVSVASFKVPTEEERDHDFLWRVHPHAPGRGRIAIFNRSHYEDVLVVRVHHLVPRSVWHHRYRAINEFERNLAREGTTLLKFFLHIDHAEQRSRLAERRRDPTKRWKLSPSDVRESRLWPEYLAAYRELLRETSTAWAPWYVIPSNHKWFRNWAISKILVDTLSAMPLAYPRGRGPAAADA